MATYGGGSLIYQVNYRTSSTFSGVTSGTIFTVPSDCNYALIKFMLVENIGPGSQPPISPGFTIQVPGISNPGFVSVDNGQLNVGTVAGNTSVAIDFLRSAFVNSGRITSQIDTTQLTADWNPEIKMYPGERMQILSIVLQPFCDWRFTWRETLVKNSTGV